MIFISTGSVTISSQIATDEDDVEEEGLDGTNNGPGGMYLTSSDLELTEDINSSHGTQKIGLRFTNLNLPVGATITNAYIDFTATTPNSPNSNSGATDLKIKAEDIDDAPAFSLTDYDVSDRTLTSAEINWIPSAWTAEQVYSTPDLSTIVQEVMNRGAWASGNDMVFCDYGNWVKKRT